MARRPFPWGDDDDDAARGSGRGRFDSGPIEPAESIKVEGGLIAQFREQIPLNAPPPKVDEDWLRHPEGPRARAHTEDGKFAPGTSGNPSSMFRPGNPISERTHGPGSEYHAAKQEAKQRRAPFAQFEIDYAIAERLKERMD